MSDAAPPHRLYRHYSELPYSMRVLFTSVLLILGLGYLFALLNIYFTYAGRAGGNPMMLSYEDIVAAYYAGLDPKPVDIQRPLTPVEWAQKCDRCHGVNGNSTRPEVPALAAQRQDYLEMVLRSYQSGARKSPEMAAMSSILSEDDIMGIAAHYAYQKPRAAVFVVVPGK